MVMVVVVVMVMLLLLLLGLVHLVLRHRTLGVILSQPQRPQLMVPATCHCCCCCCCCCQAYLLPPARL
jgi:hypothetical protein